MDKVIIDKLVQEVKEGKIKLEDIPLKWQELVKAKLDGENEV